MRLKQLRTLNNVSIETLATQLNVSKDVVVLWETNLATPSADEIIKLAAFFDVTPQFLMGNPPAPAPAPKTQVSASNVTNNQQTQNTSITVQSAPPTVIKKSSGCFTKIIIPLLIFGLGVIVGVAIASEDDTPKGPVYTGYIEENIVDSSPIL